ncbi:MAG TPA: site-2 protease family protein [Gemmatimonadota bacterium]|nr:site-2 protease family protein [Gemmatimonadota bacterium]
MIESIVYLLPVLLFSVIVHECAHGYVAEWWGDPTARMLGRLTLNPIPHIDLFGSILVPGLLLLSGSSILFGWAKPVPVTPQNFRDRRMGDITVSLAGPASNILLALVLAGVLGVASLLSGPSGVVGPVLALCYYGILLNFVLAVFNLLPIPPLDGSHVVANLLPRPAAYAYQSLGQYGLLIVFLLLFIPGLLRTIFLPARVATEVLVRLALGMS